MRTLRLGMALLALLVAATGCGDDGDEASSSTSSGSAGGGSGGSGGSGGCGPDVAAPNEEFGGTLQDDPFGGVFTMADALEALPEGDGPLRAIITTEMGVITCELEPELAPNGVANFVGLARGRRPWFDTVQTVGWVKRPFYDGLIFHRIIDDFMAQGGDRLGTGSGNAGYSLQDEITVESVHIPGTLAYANSGPNSSSSQFYITEIATDWLDGGYIVFGYCSPIATIEALAAVETDGADKPLTDVHTQTVEITRCPLP